MTDDLIRRLRDIVRSGFAHKGEDYALFHQVKEAADDILFLREEVERLTAENAALKAELNRLCPSSWDENARAWAEELRRK